MDKKLSKKSQTMLQLLVIMDGNMRIKGSNYKERSS